MSSLMYNQLMDTNHLTIQPKRPIGVLMLSAIYFLAGGFTLALYLFSPTVITLNSILILLITIIIISAAFGLSMGKIWGWWVAAIICHVNILCMIEFLLISSETAQINMIENKLEFIAILIFNLIILVYLFQKNVFEYYLFNLDTKIKKLVVSMCIGALYYLGIYFLK